MFFTYLGVLLLVGANVYSRCSTYDSTTKKLEKLAEESNIIRSAHVNKDTIVDIIKSTQGHKMFPLDAYTIEDSVSFGMYINGELKHISESLYKQIQIETGQQIEK